MFLGPLQDAAFHFERESIKSNVVATKEETTGIISTLNQRVVIV